MCLAPLFNKRLIVIVPCSETEKDVVVTPENQIILLEHLKVLPQALRLCLRKNHIHQAFPTLHLLNKKDPNNLVRDLGLTKQNQNFLHQN